MARPKLSDKTETLFDTQMTFSGNILDSATDPDGDPITVARVNDGFVAGTIGGGKGGNVFTGTYGTLTVFQDGSYEYVLNAGAVMPGDTVVESFKIKIRDDNSEYGQGFLKFEITGSTNQKPNAVDDIYTTNSSLVGGNVLLNDSDPDGDTLHVGGVIDLATGTNYHITGLGPVTIQGVYGTLVISDNGNFTYTVDYNDPDTIALGGAGGVEEFAYKPHDGQNGQGNNTDYALLTINFNSTI